MGCAYILALAGVHTNVGRSSHAVKCGSLCLSRPRSLPLWRQIDRMAGPVAMALYSCVRRVARCRVGRETCNSEPLALLGKGVFTVVPE